MHEVLVNRLGGLSLPRKSVVRLTDRPDMTLDDYSGRKTLMQQQQRQSMLSNKNKVTNTLAGSYYIDPKTRRKPISLKFPCQGRKVMVRFDAVKPNQK